MHSRLRATVSVIVLALMLAGGLFFIHRNGDKKVSISAALMPCLSGLDAIATDSCLKTSARFLLSKTSPASLMHYIIATTSPNLIVSNCHIIAHAIGEESLIQEGSLEGALSKCTQECSYGCVHGAIAEQVAQTLGETYPDEDLAHADTKELQTIGKKYCDRSLPLCHGIGHIARIASDTLSKALDVCTNIGSTEGNRNACYNGVFMEDFGKIAFAPKAALPVHADDYGYPCNSLSETYASACYLQLSDYQRASFDANDLPYKDRLTISEKVCDALTNTRRTRCFVGIGYKLDRNLDTAGNVEHAGPAICNALSENDRIACMTGLALNYATFSRYSDAITYCDSETIISDRSLCYDSVFRNITVAPSELPRVCSSAGSAICNDELDRYLKTHTVNGAREKQ